MFPLRYQELPLLVTLGKGLSSLSLSVLFCEMVSETECRRQEGGELNRLWHKGKRGLPGQVL